MPVLNSRAAFLLSVIIEHISNRIRAKRGKNRLAFFSGLRPGSSPEFFVKI
jgi:hypothetical protein